MASDRRHRRELGGKIIPAIRSAISSTILAAAVLIGGGATILVPLPACSGASVTVDGLPIDLLPASSTAAGGLHAQALYEGETGTPLILAVDTGSPLTFVRGQADGSAHMTRRSFDILGAHPRPDGVRGPDGMPVFPVRARFQGIGVLPVSLAPAPDGPDIVLGGDILRGFSVEIDFGAPAMTLWTGQRAPDSFLSGAQCGGTVDRPTCFSVLHFSLLGGGELTAVSEPDFVGLTGPVEFGPSRVLLRGCAAPAPTDPVRDFPEDPNVQPPLQPLCCTRSDAARIPAAPDPLQIIGYAPTGTNLALVVATGLGPTVISQSSWNLIVANWSRIPGVAPLPAPAPGPALAFPSLPTPLTDVLWSELPRLALVDLEADAATNPGACVELARARRLEWLEQRRAVAAPDAKVPCVQLCDTDVREPSKAQNAAGYLELGASLKVAIIPDGTAILQTVRAELRQQGPQVDGFLGTDVLATTTMEVDYGASPSRVVFSCLPGADRAACWSSPRCPRQASPGDLHSCFGLPPLALPDPESCLPRGCP